MDWYGFMVNNLPPLYRNDSTLKRYKVVAEQFKVIDKLCEELKYSVVIDLCSDEELLVLGTNLGVAKIETDSFETYRKLVKIEYYKVFIIPTHNEIKRIVKKTTGLYPSLNPLWYRGDEIENDQGYAITYDIPINFEQKILESSESVIGAGIKIVREFLFKLDGTEFKNACAILDIGTIKIGGE